MNRAIIYLLGLMASCNLNAQTIDAAAFFSQPFPSVQQISLTTGSPKMPWIERYEFRTETRDMDFEKQRYTLRLLPNSRAKRRAQQKLLTTIEAAPDRLTGYDVCKLNEGRYRDWLDLFAITRELQLLDSLEILLQDKSTYLNRRTTNSDFRWSDLISLRKSQTNLASRRNKLETTKAQLTLLYPTGTYEFDFNDFPTPKDLLDAATQPTPPEQQTPSPRTARNQYKLELVEGELALERAEQRQYVDFAQFKYLGPNDQPFGERFSIGIGLQLPNQGNQKLKIRELEIEREALQTSLRQQQSTSQAEQSQFTAFFAIKYARYEQQLALHSSEAKDLSNYGRLMLQRANPDVIEVLEINERRLRNKLQLLGLRVRLTDDYLDWLEGSEAFCTGLNGEYLRIQ